MSKDAFRRAEPTEFESFRRSLVGRAKPISGDERTVWFEKMEEMVKTVFPEQEVRSNKPGLSFKLFFFEVALPDMEMPALEHAAGELAGTWQENLPEGVKSSSVTIFPDRRDLMFEFVFDLGETYITGAVKLRCNHFGPKREEGAEGEDQDRPRRFEDRGGRPPRRDFGDRPRRFESRDDRRPDGERPRRFDEDGQEKPRFDDRGPRRDFGDRPPRRDFGGGDRGSYGGGGGNRGGGGGGYGGGDRGPRRDFGDRPPRRDFGGGGDRGPRRDFGDRPPRRDFGGGGDRGPRRDFGDRPPRRDFGGGGGGGDRGPREILEIVRQDVILAVVAAEEIAGHDEILEIDHRDVILAVVAAVEIAGHDEILEIDHQDVILAVVAAVVETAAAIEAEIVIEVIDREVATEVDVLAVVLAERNSANPVADLAERNLESQAALTKAMAIQNHHEAKIDFKLAS